MKKNDGYLRNLFSTIFLVVLLTSCAAQPKSCKTYKDANHSMTDHSGIKRVYVPEYFVYRRGKYEFVKGHYRLVIFPKLYAKRSLKGYTTGKRESASIR